MDYEALKPNVCSICETLCQEGFSVSGIPIYFCDKCYGLYKDAITTQSKWTSSLERLEHDRRVRRNKFYNAGYLPGIVLSSLKGDKI